MIVIKDHSDYKVEQDTYIALGSFDGLHKGHMGLINSANTLAKANKAKSMVYTFENHPLSVINTDASPKLLMDNDTKIQIIGENDIDIVCMAKFNKNIMEMSPQEFILHIINDYNMKGVVVGFNYRFGYNNLGDTELLKDLGEKMDFEVHIMEAIVVEGEVVSSTRIRRAILDGNIQLANKMLLRPFMLKGKVIHGKKLGRTLGFPTANIDFNNQIICPKTGVYYTNVEVDGEIYKGITDVGYNPTVESSGLTIETYVLDFSSDIYDRDISVYFIERMRDEIKFGSLEELKIQLENDKGYAEGQKIELNK